MTLLSHFTLGGHESLNLLEFVASEPLRTATESPDDLDSFNII